MPKLNAREQLAVWQGLYPAPCQAACPVHTDARTYVTLVGKGQYQEAFAAARAPNPLSAICGRACSAPCEDVCTRGEFDRPVRIRQLKRFLTERFIARPSAAGRPPASGKAVAVVGAGPAGLAAAHDLARLGHAVTIYDSASEPGGMATLGVPRFRLAMDAIHQDAGFVEQLGVTVRLGLQVGRDVSFEQLRRQNDAVFIASGATRLNGLSAPGMDLPGVVQALPYLTEANLGGRPATGRLVAVIGGGYTAMDAARTAVRLGAEQVTVLYRRTRSETEVHEEELRATIEEGVRIDYLVAPVGADDDGTGRVTALVCVRNRLGEKDVSGRPRPVPIPGSDFRFPADMVILALGQTPDAQELDAEHADLLRQVDPETLMTPLAGVFAGGDFVTGPSTIIEAVEDGRIAAASIHAYLAGTPPPGTATPDGDLWPLEAIPRPLTAISPNGQHAPLALDREVEPTLTKEEATSEGLRCLFCGLLPHIVVGDCTVCHACVPVCPVDCIYSVAIDEGTGAMRPATSFREVVSYKIDDSLCIRCGRCFKACPVGAIVVEV